MGNRRRRFRAKEVLGDETLFAREIKKGRLGNLITLLRNVGSDTERENDLLVAIGKWHLDNRLIVDHREHWKMIEYARDMGWEVEHLETGSGDYRSEMVAFERKEGDLSPSVYDRRLSKQLTAMRESSEFSFLIITRTWAEVKQDLAERGVSDEVLIGIVASCCASGYPPLFIGSGYDSTRLMKRIARKVGDDRHRLYVPRPTKPNPQEYKLAMIEALPTIGRVMAKKLLKSFGSISALANADVETLCSVDGIGQKTAERILEVLR